MHDCIDSGDKFSNSRFRVRLSIHLDNSGEGKRYVEYANPCIGLVFDVAGGGTFIRVDTHEDLASLRKLADEFVVVGDQLLDGSIVAEISQVTEDWHESFRLEREGVDVDLSSGVRWEYDALVLDLVGEKCRDDSKKA